MIADKMVSSLRETAQLTHHATADASALVTAKERFDRSGQKTSIEDLAMFAVIRTLVDFQELNARLEQGAINMSRPVHLCVAIGLPNNLLVAPAIFDAQSLSLSELRAARQDLAARARTNALSVREMTGGTFTISNLGLSRVEHFTPILNAPQVAILGLGRMVEKPVKDQEGKIAFVPHIGLSLTFDHRAVDGAPAAAFLTAVCESLESSQTFA